MDQDRRQLGALPCQSADIFAGQDQDLRWLLGGRLPRGTDQPGVRKKPRHVAFPPFRDPARTGAAIREQRDASGQQREQALDRRALHRKRIPHLEPANGSVLGQPFELLARRGAQRPVLRQPVDEIVLGHGSDTSG